MKEFHAELAANPAHYSYGYSVYGELEEGDNLAAILARGFQPCTLVADAPPMVYMNRMSRVRVQEFEMHSEHRRILRKFEGGTQMQVRIYPWKNYPEPETAQRIILEYFTWRHGKESMPPERLERILTFQNSTSIVEYRIGGKIAGYSIEMHRQEVVYLWYFAYLREYKNNLGARIVLDVIVRAKGAGKTYAYLGSSYGSHMRYKGNYQPLEYWNGRAWNSADGKAFRTLLRHDAFRSVVTSDNWRSTHREFYPAPHSYRSGSSEFRFVYAMLTGAPRVTLLFAAWLIILALAFLALLP